LICQLSEIIDYLNKFSLPVEEQMSIKVEARVAAGNYLFIGVVLDFNVSLKSVVLRKVVASPAWVAGGHERTPRFDHEVGNGWEASPAEKMLELGSVWCSLLTG